jgi:hypothetical protein
MAVRPGQTRHSSMAMTPEPPPTSSSCCFPGSAAGGPQAGFDLERGDGWPEPAARCSPGVMHPPRWPPWPQAWIWYPASQYGTSVARPAIAPADAARSHHHLDRNTPHAASVNNARLTSAPTVAIAHAAPPGGLLVPANDAVIHKNVLPYTSSVAAATFRRVLRLRPPGLSVRPLVLAP